MTGRRDPDELVARAGEGDPNQDQYYLIDDRVLDRIPTHLDGDLGHVLEIGAGAGVLTDRLLAATDTVTAIERDSRLVRFLREEFAEEREAGALTVVHGDALEVEFPAFDTCISNLPYGISGPVLFRLLPLRRPLLVMVQREFGERMAAGPGDDAYGRLSVTAQHFAAVELVEPVPPTAFNPSPPVESVLVKTTPRDPDYDVDTDAFLQVVRAVFTQRRKTMRNAIRNTTHISGIGDAEAVINALDETVLGRRPEALSPRELASVTKTSIDVGELA